MNLISPVDTQIIEFQDLGLRDYEPVWRSMQEYTANRDNYSLDMIWCLEHEPVYTIGYNGDKSHLRKNVSIPLIRVDRGGQITYHGPGQLIIYFLIDLKRRNCGIKSLVNLMENAIIKLLESYDVNAHRIDTAPGVYVDQKKIAALGVRAKKFGCYHGLSLNVNMDLKPFDAINPCGYKDLTVTQLKDLGGPEDLNRVSKDLSQFILNEFTQLAKET